jgi:putative transposase
MLRSDYPVTMLCDLLHCARSSYYRRADPPDETDLEQAIKSVMADWPTYGTRRVTAQLRRRGWAINRKRTQLVQDLAIVRPEQVWVSDITYIRLADGFVYLAVIMDVFTRNIRGWHLGQSLDQSLTLLALQRALAYGVPEIHHSDQGVQYAATAYTRMLHAVNVQISMADAGEAWQNGYAERLLRTIKEEEVDLSEYLDYGDALQQIGRFLDDVYTHKRIHSSLGYLTPAEFEVQWLEERQTAQIVN